MIPTTKTATRLATVALTLLFAACQLPTDAGDKKEASKITVYLGETTETTVAKNATIPANSAVLGTPSTTTLTVKNTGKAALTLKAPVLTGADAALFTIATPPASTLAVGAFSSLVLTFTPTEVATGKTATVTLANNSANAPSFAFTVVADATPVPAASLVVSVAGTAAESGLARDLGAIDLGAAAGVTVTLNNNGTAPMTGIAASLSATTDFTLASAPAETLDIGQSTTLTLTLKTTGARSVVLNLANSSANAPAYSLTLSGTGFVTSKVYYVTQSATPTDPTKSWANYATNRFDLKNGYTSSNNNFVYQAGPSYYGKLANSFLTFPTLMSGDFTLTATISNLTSGGGAGSGIGLGMTTGFTPADKYAYTLLTNTSSINTTYVSAAAAVTNTAVAGTDVVASYTGGASAVPVNITFKRVGSTLSFGASSGALASLDANLCTDGTTVFGTGSVYPALSFVRTSAVVTDLVLIDGTGRVLYDSANGGVLGTYVPAALSVGSSTVNLAVGTSLDVSALANADGYDAPGAVGTVTAATTAGTGSVSTAVTNGAAGSTVSITGVTAGTATVTVTSDAATGSKVKTIAVTVTSYPTTDAAYTLGASALYPAPGTTSAYTDGELAMTFDTVPTLETGGLIKIFKKSDGSEVDSIAFAAETQAVPTSASSSVTMNVTTQLVRIDSATKTVFITPHFGKLQYGTAYYVSFPSTSLAGTFGGAAFDGLSADKSVATWNFTTRAAPALNATSVTVNNSQTNTTSDFRTLGGALMHLVKNPIAGATAITIDVAAGTYTELVQYRPATANLAQTFTIQGPTNTRGSTCTIQYTNGGGINSSAQNMRASFYFTGANLVLRNLTIKNTGVRSAVSQAEALYFDSKLGSTLAVNNCSLISRQDTINTTGRNWFYNCYIEGNVDFIWGTADAALFEKCALQVVYDGTTNTASNPYSLLVARTNGLNADNTYATSIAGFTGTVGKGYVLKDSTVSVQSPSIITLGRNAGAGQYFDQVAVINTVFSTDATATGVIGSATNNYLWSSTTAPTKLGDSSYVGFKSAGNTGLNLAALTTSTAAFAASSIADQATEYATRDQILNRAVTVGAGVPTGYQTSTLGTWDVSSLAASFGAP